jgi:glycosyltransferase involved in cell wall biosynthesis
MIASVIRRVPLFGRCGYLPTQLYSSQFEYPRLKLALHRLLELGFLKYSTVVSVPSKHQIRYLADKHVGIRKKLVRLPNFVDTEVFRPTKRECILGDIIFVGRLHKEKNIESLIIAAHNIDASLTIVGDGELRQSLEGMSKRLGLQVSFLGQVDQKTLPKLICSHLCFALPSFAEGMPKALLEAMACGTCCVGVNVDGVKEFIVDGENGFIAENPSANNIGVAIQRALDQGTKKIGEQAVEYVDKNFSIRVVCELEKDVYQNLMGVQAKPSIP